MLKNTLGMHPAPVCAALRSCVALLASFRSGKSTVALRAQLIAGSGCGDEAGLINHRLSRHAPFYSQVALWRLLDASFMSSRTAGTLPPCGNFSRSGRFRRSTSLIRHAGRRRWKFASSYLADLVVPDRFILTWSALSCSCGLAQQRIVIIQRTGTAVSSACASVPRS